MANNCTRMIPFDALYLEGNVRTPECEDTPGMVASLQRHGFKVNHPLVLSEKKGEDGPKYLVLIGNRRTLGLQWLKENDQPEFDRVLNECKGKIPAVVHRNLTPEQETILRIDHSKDEDRVALDDFSVFTAIKQLLQNADASQETIARSLGLFIARGKNKGQPNRSLVQPRTNLARLPQFVQDEYRKLTLDKDSTPFRMADVAKLYKVFNEEYIEHPDGDGPGFTALWYGILHPEEKEDTVLSRDDAKELTPADAIKRSQAASSEGVKNILLCVTQQSTKDLATIDANLVAAEAALGILAEIREYLGTEEYTVLRDNARKQAEAQAESDRIDDAAEVHDTEYAHPEA